METKSIQHTKDSKTAPKDYWAIKNRINLCEAFVIFVLYMAKIRCL